MRSIVCAVLFSILLWSRPANADRITIEPDDFAAGTNLSAATAGVMLWTAHILGSSGNPLSLSPVYAQHSGACDDALPTLCYAATGAHGFSPFSAPEGDLFSWNSVRHPANCFGSLNNAGFPGNPNTCTALPGYTAMLIELSTPTSFLEIAGAWNSDYLELRALSEDFNLLSLPQTLTQDPRLSGYATTGTVAMTAPDAIMKYIFAGSTEGGIALDRLSFDQVPEPSTLLLTLAGLVVLGRHLRRRTRSE